MRKWLLVVLVVVAVALGVAGGYAVAVMEAVSNTPFLSPRHSNKEGFDGVVEDFAKLGGYESVAANCDGASETQPSLTMEAEVIRDLQKRNGSDANLIRVAEAKSLVRNTIVIEKNFHANQPSADAAQRAENLLRNAGWINPSEAHMRDVVLELDRDQCRQVMLAGGR